MLNKSDAQAVMAATRIGYEILSDESGFAWYRKKGGKCIGPYRSIQDAVQCAVNEYDRIKLEEFLRHAQLPERS